METCEFWGRELIYGVPRGGGDWQLHYVSQDPENFILDARFRDGNPVSHRAKSFCPEWHSQ